MKLKDIVFSTVSPLLRRVPTNIKLLYPFYLSAQLQTRSEEYRSPALPPAFDGFKIAYASDVHYGAYLGPKRANELIEQLGAFDADLMILGGDYGERLDSAIAFFDLIPRFQDSKTVLASLGNHDHGTPAEPLSRLIAAMLQKNVRPLVNEVWKIEREGAVIAVCATDDPVAGSPDFKPLLAGITPTDFVLFAPHSPDMIPDAVLSGLRFHLALCGHTHGGQIVLFQRSLVSSSRYKDRYRAGWYRENESDIFVSCGVGTSILPMRLGTRPEIHCFTLRTEG